MKINYKLNNLVNNCKKYVVFRNNLIEIRYFKSVF